MERNLNLKEVTDGKVYTLNDMAKIGCNDCAGCSACCRGMGNSILLDPLDVYRLCQSQQCSFEELLKDRLELNVVDGVILPNLKMAETTGACTFLDSEGRCSIHPARPGICRIFPLGRIYENNSFQYIYQIHECERPNKTKVKVSKWIDTPKLLENQEYISQWHYFLKDVERLVKKADNPDVTRQLDMYILNLFFVTAYDYEKDFYIQFQERMDKAKHVVETLKEAE